MQVIGTAPAAVLAKFEARGFTPQQTVNALVAEGKRRFPRAMVIIVKSDHHDGIDLVAI